MNFLLSLLREGISLFISVLQPKFPIPRRITIARDCWSLYINEKQKLKNMFTNSNQGVSFTIDCWTSVQILSYPCLTAHFIDGNWKLHLNSCPLANHKGETIGKNLRNASSNDVAMSY